MEEKMRTVIIVASARKGNSLFIAEKIKSICSNETAEIIQLSDYNIKYCTGCLVCDETHACPIQDDMTFVLDRIISADSIVFISPTRYSLVSGDGKVFIDRLNPTAVTGELEGKKFVAIAIGQTGEKEKINSVAIAAESLVSFAENAGLNVLGKFSIYECYSEQDIRKNVDIEKVCKDVVKLLNKEDK